MTATQAAQVWPQYGSPTRDPRPVRARAKKSLNETIGGVAEQCQTMGIELADLSPRCDPQLRYNSTDHTLHPLSRAAIL